MEKGTLVGNYLDADSTELIDSAKTPPRINAAHSKYEAVDDYTYGHLSVPSTGNFIAAIVGVLVKTAVSLTLLKSVLAKSISLAPHLRIYLIYLTKVSTPPLFSAPSPC